MIGTSGDRFPAGAEVSFSVPHPDPLWGPLTSCPLGTGCYFPGVKQPESKTDLSPPSVAEVWNVWSHTSAPLIRLYGLVRK